MLALFYIFIGIAIGVSFWQITRILNLRGVIATDEDNAKQGKYSLVFMAFLYAMMVYCLIFMNVLMLPESASIEGEHDDNLFNITFWLIGIVQFVMQFIIFYFTFKYKGNKNRKAKFYADSHKLEAIWTITPAVVLISSVLKGEVEKTIEILELPSVAFFRPSFLLGDRKEFRLAENISKVIFKLFSFL